MTHTGRSSHIRSDRASGQRQGIGATPEAAAVPMTNLITLRAYALVLLALGLALLGGGVYLIRLGGSPYYVLYGSALTASAVLLWQRHGSGAMLYGVTVLLTLAWGIWESGYNGWALLSHMLLPVLLGLVLFVPAVRRSLIWPAMRRLR